MLYSPEEQLFPLPGVSAKEQEVPRELQQVVPGPECQPELPAKIALILPRALPVLPVQLFLVLPLPEPRDPECRPEELQLLRQEQKLPQQELQLLRQEQKLPQQELQLLRQLSLSPLRLRLLPSLLPPLFQILPHGL